MDKRYVIALELSGSQVKGAAASLPKSPNAPMQAPAIEAVACVDNAQCVQYGRVQNIIDATKHACFVAQKLENSLSPRGGKIEGVYAGLAGRSLGSVHTVAEIELPSEMEITDEIMAKLFDQAALMAQTDKKVLKVLPRKFVIDNQANANPVGTLGSRIKGEFTVVTCSQANASNLELVLNERAQLPIKGFVITPLAVADLVLGEEEKHLGVALVDIGAQTTTVSVYKGRALQYLATLPIGSRHITLDIAHGMNITEERAEMAKCTQASAAAPAAAPASEDVARVNCYVQARMGEILANVMAQISYAGYQPADLAAGMVLTGRGAKLDGIEQMVEDQCKMKVRFAGIPTSVAVADHSLSPSDITSLIAIAAEAARMCHDDGCIAWPQAQALDQQFDYGCEEPHGPSMPAFDPFEADSSDDWKLDDDDAQKRRREQERRDVERRASQAARMAEAERKRIEREQDQQRRDEKKKLEADRKRLEAEEKKRRELLKEQEKEAKRKEKEGKGSMFQVLKDKITSMISYDPNKNDYDMDDDSGYEDMETPSRK